LGASITICIAWQSEQTLTIAACGVSNSAARAAGNWGRCNKRQPQKQATSLTPENFVVMI
jgi:hypothetical protein